MFSLRIATTIFEHVQNAKEKGNNLLFIKLSVQTFQLQILLHRWGNFVYYWGCALIYRALSYPFRPLTK